MGQKRRKLDKQRLVSSMRNDTPVPPWNIYLAKRFSCQHFHTRPQMNGFFFFAATALHDEILPVAVRVPFSSL
jgi:ribosomal protein L39E